jgi:uncharacterized damage-inducible protein DinB
MAGRGQELARQVEAVNAEALAFLGTVADDEWGLPTPHEGWSVGVTAYHIAALYPETVELLQLTASGKPLPQRTQADIDHANAARAAEHANTTRAEVVELLKKNGATAVAAVGALSDEELARSAPFFGLYQWTAEAVAEGLIIGHTRSHLQSIQQAVELGRARSQRRRADALARRLETANQEVIAFVEQLPDAQWRGGTANESWSVAVAAHHVGALLPETLELVQRVVSGQPLPQRTQADIDAANAERARAAADVTKAQVLDQLRANGAAAAAAVRQLSDDELDRTALFFGLYRWSAEAVVEGLMIGHARNHLKSMRLGVAGATT